MGFKTFYFVAPGIFKNLFSNCLYDIQWDQSPDRHQNEKSDLNPDQNGLDPQHHALRLVLVVLGNYFMTTLAASGNNKNSKS
jgi:hypothetical protein